MEYIYNSDGSNSHPKGFGPAGAAFVINGRDPHYILLPEGTNNVCELTAIVEAMEHFVVSCPIEDTAIFKSDSQWTVRIIAGIYNLPYHPIKYGLAHSVKERMGELFKRLDVVFDDHRMAVWWVPREENSAADHAANVARERAMEKYK